MAELVFGKGMVRLSKERRAFSPKCRYLTVQVGFIPSLGLIMIER